MQIQSRLPIESVPPAKASHKAAPAHTRDALAQRTLQEDKIDQRRVQEQLNLRRAQQNQAEKGRQVDRYA